MRHFSVAVPRSILAPILPLLASSGLLASDAAAQRAQPGLPASVTAQLPAEDFQVVLPSPDVARLLAEDSERNDWPFRYGAPLSTAFSLEDSGRWDELANGDLVWRLRITSPGAESLGVLFDEFELPESGRLFLYDRARTTLVGAFTSASRQPNGMLAVQPVPGDDLVVEYVQDAAEQGRPLLRIGEVVHDYRGVLRMLDQGPVALMGSCLVDINCPQGSAYQDIKRSVIMVISSGALCSAGMLNNTAQDATPYFLTANHCGGMANVVAYFGYERSGCGTGSTPPNLTISGATLLAASTNFDSQLYRLSSTPPQSYEPFFAGWDRSLSPAAPGISISHPSGNPKKLARDTGAPVNSGRQWLVTWELGMLEGGSSGSPLFNGSKRVIGPACCVSDFGCSSQWAFYGRFNGFWQAENLDQWLDPLGLGVQFVDGLDPFQAYAVPYIGSGSNLLAYTSTSAPAVGTTWTATIDTSLIPGAASSWILGHAAPTSGVFVGAGELLVSLASPRLFLSIAPSVGGSSLHSNPIPNDPLLIGQIAYTQGVIFASGFKLLTNGVELHLK